MKHEEWPQKWIFLQEACGMKGVKYNSICHTKELWRQPNCGQEEGIICGHRAWRPETIRTWILMDDVALKKAWEERVKKAARAAAIKDIA